MVLMLSGAMVTAYLIAGVFFLRFWRETGERLFAIFAVAFWLLALQRMSLSLAAPEIGNAIWPYVVRLAAFLLILYAIVDKNRTRPAAARG